MTYGNEMVRIGKIQLYLLHWQIRSTMTAIWTHALRPTSYVCFCFYVFGSVSPMRRCTVSRKKSEMHFGVMDKQNRRCLWRCTLPRGGGSDHIEKLDHVFGRRILWCATLVLSSSISAAHWHCGTLQHRYNTVIHQS